MSLQRAIQLRELHRHEEAEALFLQYLASEPEDPTGHVELALTRLEMDKRGKDALESIETAISLEPEVAEFFAIQSLVLTKIGQDEIALKAAEKAVALDAELPFAWATKGSALGAMQKWQLAEEACRQALVLDADYEFALNQLAIFLRMQGKVDDSSGEVAARLERDAEDPLAHANAGWASFQAGDLKQAEIHFQESLRLEPTMEYARMGLRETYKARSVFYRIYLKWVFFLQKYSEKQQLFIMLGVFLAYRVGRGVLQNIDTRLAIALAVLYGFFAFGSFLASGIGSFLLLKDRAARLTLTRPEKLEGFFVGGGFFLGLLLVALAFVVLPTPFAFLGAALILAGVPGGMFWDNESLPGKIVFGGLMAAVYLGGLVFFGMRLSGGEFGGGEFLFLLIALFAGVGSTWLSMVPGLRRGKGE